MFKTLTMKSSIFVLLFLLIFSITNAQTGDKKTAPALLDEQRDLQAQLIPLDSIIEIAVKHSPSVKFQTNLIQSAKSQLEFSKRLWTNNIVGFVNYSTGNQSIVTADSQNAGTLAASNITSGYRMGVQLNLPLYELVGRKSRINIYKYELNSTVNKKDESIQELKKEVIQVYYSLLYYNNLLTIRSEAKQSTINQYLLAQKQFQDGIIDIAELSRLKTIEVNARADYEEAKRQFSTLYFQVEPLVGVSIQQLIKK
jgi:outer membrane protein TolC